MGKLTDLHRGIQAYQEYSEPVDDTSEEDSISFEEICGSLDKVTGAVSGLSADSVAKEIKALRGAVNRLINGLKELPKGEPVTLPDSISLDAKSLEKAIQGLVERLDVEKPKPEPVRYEIVRDEGGVMASVVVRPDIGVKKVDMARYE